jgi:hypothetical protein
LIGDGQEHNGIQAHCRQIARCNQRGGRMLSIVDLIEAGTITPELAAYSLAAIGSGASFLVGAMPGGAGHNRLCRRAPRREPEAGPRGSNKVFRAFAAPLAKGTTRSLLSLTGTVTPKRWPSHGDHDHSEGQKTQETRIYRISAKQRRLHSQMHHMAAVHPGDRLMTYHIGQHFPCR